MSEDDMKESRDKVIYWLKYQYKPVISVKLIPSSSTKNKTLKSNVAERKISNKMKITDTQDNGIDSQSKTKKTKSKMKKCIKETIKHTRKISPQNKTDQVNLKNTVLKLNILN